MSNAIDDLDPTFRPIDGRPGYECNLRGEVRSWRRRGPVSGRREAPVTLRQFFSCGYLTVGTRDANNKLCPMTIHALVLTLKSGPRPAGMQCRHLDGNKLNNHPDNLVWGTSLENIRDNVRHGTNVRGERSPKATITETRAKELLIQIAVRANLSELAREIGVSRSMLKDMKIGRTWKHLPRPWHSSQPAQIAHTGGRS